MNDDPTTNGVPRLHVVRTDSPLTGIPRNVRSDDVAALVRWLDERYDRRYGQAVSEPPPCGRGSLTCSRPDDCRSCYPHQRTQALINDMKAGIAAVERPGGQQGCCTCPVDPDGPDWGDPLSTCPVHGWVRHVFDEVRELRKQLTETERERDEYRDGHRVARVVQELQGRLAATEQDVAGVLAAVRATGIDVADGIAATRAVVTLITLTGEYRQQRDSVQTELLQTRARLREAREELYGLTRDPDGRWEPAGTRGRPVQARDARGLPLFIHGCGAVMPSSVPGVAKGEHHRYPPCPTPGPWRPLYVTETAPATGPTPPPSGQQGDPGASGAERGSDPAMGPLDGQDGVSAGREGES